MTLHPDPKRLHIAQMNTAPVSKQVRKFRAQVNTMTNWQRHQWRRAKYPGLHLWEENTIRPFLQRKRPDRKRN